MVLIIQKKYIYHIPHVMKTQKRLLTLWRRFPKMKGKVLINDIGTTIGSHTGPGTVALYFWGKKRVD